MDSLSYAGKNLGLTIFYPKSSMFFENPSRSHKLSSIDIQKIYEKSFLILNLMHFYENVYSVAKFLGT